MIGETFLSEAVQTSNGEKKHLFIIIAEKDDSFLAVPVSTYDPTNRYCNSDCLLSPNDHPFLDRQSWIDFSKARTYTYFELQIKYSNYTFEKKEDIDEPILSLIIAKAEASEDLPEKFLSFFEKE